MMMIMLQVAVAVAAAEDAAPFSDEETWRKRRCGRENSRWVPLSRHAIQPILCESP